MISQKLNPQAKAITDAQSEIKAWVNKLYLEGRSRDEIERKVREIIKKYKAKLTSEELRKLLPQSMTVLYKWTLLTLVVAFGTNGRQAQRRIRDVQAFLENKATEQSLMRDAKSVVYDAQRSGQPLNQYCRDYMKKVKDVYRNVAKEDARDLTGQTVQKGTLRNKAEMQVRYEAQQEQLAQFKAQGEKLVVCSSHQDCSVRCFKWQGRVYSLDGSQGKTEDGREYIPLEIATNQNQVYYVNPNTGTQYKGGLFGYNCRHYLKPYRVGMGIPTVTKAQQQRESEITQRQRELERTVRKWRDEAELTRSAGLSKEARLCEKKASRAYEKYKTYSMDNGRAYYPDRVSIF